MWQIIHPVRKWIPPHRSTDRSGFVEKPAFLGFLIQPYSFYKFHWSFKERSWKLATQAAHSEEAVTQQENSLRGMFVQPIATPAATFQKPQVKANGGVLKGCEAAHRKSSRRCRSNHTPALCRNHNKMQPWKSSVCCLSANNANRGRKHSRGTNKPYWWNLPAMLFKGHVARQPIHWINPAHLTYYSSWMKYSENIWHYELRQD